jgi:uncharacterized protein (DUF488 family)
VRRFPASRKHPQFNRESMERALAEAGIEYRHFEHLGGRRPARPDSRNIAWRNASFRGYADYMESFEYQSAEKRLIDLSTTKKTALMCAESVWWRCHRGLIADSLKARGWEVLHIADAASPKEHPYTGAARVVDGRLTYSAGQDKLL